MTQYLAKHPLAVAIATVYVPLLISGIIAVSMMYQRTGHIEQKIEGLSNHNKVQDRTISELRETLIKTNTILDRIDHNLEKNSTDWSRY